ncbi:MAG: hypothetical protein PHQ98_00600 [Candidatus ainarchaeum sp.]|nr:hypothetical protein [Candidatus ainarchaeum sp.]
MEKKKYFVILAVWFIVTFAIMWFFGGSCTTLFSSTGDECISTNILSGIRNVPLIGYILPYNAWVSFFYWFSPVAGFFLAYLMIKWYNKTFETNNGSGPVMLVMLIVLLFAGYFINLTFYYSESAALNSNSQVNYTLSFCFAEDTAQKCNENVYKVNQQIASSATAYPVSQYFPVSYWSELRESIYLIFMLGAISAWLFLFITENVFSQSKSNLAHHKHKKITDDQKEFE